MCDVCKKYVHKGDPSKLPDDWKCPICGADKTHLTIDV